MCCHQTRKVCWQHAVLRQAIKACWQYVCPAWSSARFAITRHPHLHLRRYQTRTLDRPRVPLSLTLSAPASSAMNKRSHRRQIDVLHTNWRGTENRYVVYCYMLVNIDVHTYTCRYIRIYAGTYIYALRYIDIYRFIYRYRYIYIYIGDIYINLDIYIDIYRYIPICIYIWMYIFVLID